MTPEVIETLAALRKKVVIGFVGGSDFVKISEQLTWKGSDGASTNYLPHGASILTFSVRDDFDYAFAENGLTAYKSGKELQSQSFIKFLGEEKYKKMVNFILHYLADLDVPIKRYERAGFSLPCSSSAFAEERSLSSATA